MTWVEDLLEKLPYSLRPLKLCTYQRCYVFTANRVDGEPFCHACVEMVAEGRLGPKIKSCGHEYKMELGRPICTKCGVQSDY